MLLLPKKGRKVVVMKKELLITVVLSLVLMSLSGWAQTASAQYSLGDWIADMGVPIDATDIGPGAAGITVIRTNDLAGMDNLHTLELGGNQITTIEPGAFSGKQSIFRFEMDPNPLTGLLNLSGAQFRDLTFFSIRSTAVDAVDLTNAELSQVAFNGISGGGGGLRKGIASAGIIEIDFAGANLSDVEQLNGLYSAVDLQQLNLANVTFADAIVNDNYDEVVQLIVALERETLNFLTIDMDVYASHESYFNDWDSVLFNELTVVPEPTTMFLITAGGLTLLRRKRRR